MGKARQYWSQVFRRVARAALDDMRLGVVPVAVSFASQVVIAVIVFAGLGEWTDANVWTRIGTAAAPFALYPAAFALRTLTVPATMHLEGRTRIEDLERLLATFQPVQHDVNIEMAIAYVLTGDWSAPIWNGTDERIAGWGSVVSDMEERAHRGLLTVWGKAGPQARHTAIPSTFWEHGKIDLESFLSPSWTITTNRVRVLDPSRYEGIHLNRSQVEREWPRATA